MLFRRLFSSSVIVQAASKTSLRKTVKPSEEIPDVNAFLGRIGRKCDEFTDTYENKWDNLFTWGGPVLKEKGIPIQQRRYILNQVEKLRKGEEIKEIKKGKKSFFGGERKRKETIAKWRAEQRNAE
ncbi:mitochondrial 37S ribosomal protein mS41 [Kluyveromyces lactis]|uniref:Small ribosomal subunit protein mS41 n=1 Tax=Kluyveromyces lactis (strain ATCC 8585 / CBS 2359 / DSM 70799 / NBRC 1267 / NRRL Y-1140 / WM37) TaxID=284590 RepID=FYV4_KLULA|nr:uncharacterized protein KLLA0_C10164g [Kluyveromyces lactis]Q6CTT7.1 RecName: Full=Small ribosomal subunit protein mS41; AltName: Full=Protein FYV4, mitochondrial; Flags: Precursor [Kluyveromyces lactis NRRL Y-1140]CAH01503.1 KLLA0C10164p [Kluyveromyces lactis]|eukprot:XP_452652.1 uncharacterized protein KLLA0_C10164g [Kluyveromyces lactis]